MGAALALARLTALRKLTGGVRGIATGDCFRRLVARALAKQWAPVFDAATRPFPYALQARSGTDALASQLGVAFERDVPRVVPDGFATRGPEPAPFRPPFLRAPAHVLLVGQRGRAEGSVSGDPLAPALFAIGQHAALSPDGEVSPFLDEFYRARAARG